MKSKIKNIIAFMFLQQIAVAPMSDWLPSCMKAEKKEAFKQYELITSTLACNEFRIPNPLILVGPRLLEASPQVVANLEEGHTYIVIARQMTSYEHLSIPDYWSEESKKASKIVDRTLGIYKIVKGASNIQVVIEEQFEEDYRLTNCLRSFIVRTSCNVPNYLSIEATGYMEPEKIEGIINLFKLVAKEFGHEVTGGVRGRETFEIEILMLYFNPYKHKFGYYARPQWYGVDEYEYMMRVADLHATEGSNICDIDWSTFSSITRTLFSRMLGRYSNSYPSLRFALNPLIAFLSR